MPKRCANPCCGNILKKDRPRNGPEEFCSSKCWESYLTQGKRFEEAVDPFHEPFKPPKRHEQVARR